ncbi:MAG: hypothetical protein M9887_05155 [Chitinophagales bacterium]|nr:hypothetical protein [Chitinophagales bacterium]
MENQLKKNLVLFPIFSTTETQRNRLTTFAIESTSSEPCRGELIQVRAEN